MAGLSHLSLDTACVDAVLVLLMASLSLASQSWARVQQIASGVHQLLHSSSSCQPSILSPVPVEFHSGRENLNFIFARSAGGSSVATCTLGTRLTHLALLSSRGQNFRHSLLLVPFTISAESCFR